MVGDAKRREIADTIRGAAKDAGTMMLITALGTALALGLAAAALILALRAVRH